MAEYIHTYILYMYTYKLYTYQKVRERIQREYISDILQLTT